MHAYVKHYCNSTSTIVLASEQLLKIIHSNVLHNSCSFNMYSCGVMHNVYYIIIIIVHSVHVHTVYNIIETACCKIP